MTINRAKKRLKYYLAFILEFVENGGNEGEIRECYAEAIAKILRKARGEM